MNKTIKVIELLNKIANGEEIPKKIKYMNFVFELNNYKYGRHYYNEDVELIQLINHNFSNLNDEVEIIEESEEIDIQAIKELLTIEDYEFDKTDGRLNRDKINELIRAVKQLDKK